MFMVSLNSSSVSNEFQYAPCRKPRSAINPLVSLKYHSTLRPFFAFSFTLRPLLPQLPPISSSNRTRLRATVKNTTPRKVCQMSTKPKKLPASPVGRVFYMAYDVIGSLVSPPYHLLEDVPPGMDVLATCRESFHGDLSLPCLNT